MSDDNMSTPTHDRAGNNEHIRLKSLPEKFSALNLLDPRSPTTAFKRTPIQVILKNARSNSAEEKYPDEVSPNTTSASSASFVSLSTPGTMVDESLELSANSASFMSFDELDDFCSFDLSSRDLSIMVSDFSSCTEDPDEEPALVIQNELDCNTNSGSVEIESRSQDAISESSVIPSSADLEDKSLIQESESKECTPSDVSSGSTPLIRKKQLKNMFFTPNPSKKRNPLGPVDNICPTTPPSHKSSASSRLCDKQWKRIQEERKKLGLESDENAQLPLYDITASAPSKLVRKSRLQARFNEVRS